ncbi:PREDICTED: phospholipase A1-like, partial [Vollenhovia emeryi]|uniref:phospholipase A1-like n=1 Tax=Vollenhovia emeryi TaxID=411798 RepID=UPI0005F54916
VSDHIIAILVTDLINCENKVSDSCIFGVENVLLYLFTSNITNGQVVKANEICSYIDLSKPVIFLTHGFISNAKAYNFSVLASRLVENGYTVVSLDWADGSCYDDFCLSDINIFFLNLGKLNLLEYPFATKNTREVGNYLASSIKSVIKCGVKLENITLMGHSLGAHISAFAAKNITKTTDYGKPPLLIGTDPAAPLFEGLPCKYRFCDGDAKRVLAFHTSILGIQQTIADCDFWFNNGFDQPACNVWSIPGTGAANTNCSHNIAIDYLANTLLKNCTYAAVPIGKDINPLPNLKLECSPKGTECIAVDDKVFDPKSTTMGNYCVNVSSEYPYCTNSNCTRQE